MPALRWIGRFLGKLGLMLWFGSLTLVIGLVLAYLAYNARTYDRVYRGVSVLGIDLGGLTPAEALATLHDELAPQRLPDVVLQVADDRTYVGLAELGCALDLTSTVADAYALGRGGTLLQDMLTRLRLLWQGYDVVPPLTLQAGAAELALRPLARAESDPARRARLSVSGLEAHVRPAATGRQLDIAGTMTALSDAVTDSFGVSGWRADPRAPALALSQATGGDALVLEPLTVQVQFTELAPLLGEVAGASQDVASLLGAPLVLSWMPPGGASEQRWLVDQATLASWLSLTNAGPEATPHVALDQTAITAFTRSLQTEIDRPALAGRFGYDAASSSLTVIQPEQAGYTLDVAAAERAITAQALSPERRIALPVTTAPPAVSEAQLRAMLPLELLGEGATQFVGSAASRQANIVMASRAFEGVTIAAGETFSFLDVLGPVNRATGYEESWVILGNRTELGPGGGVCQVATTCFRAAFWAGLPIVERHPHAYRVSWYEPPVGLDASVFEPYVDLQFTNDYAEPLLVQVAVDEQAQTLVFRFYGRGDGRVVTMDGPVSSSPRPAPEPVYETDATLAPGASVQVERAHEGLDVTIVRHTAWPNGARDDYDLTTRYAAWPARYLVGPAASAPTN